MRVSVCVGNYAKTPYCVPGLEINVCSMEELCYCMKENAFLLDMSLMDDGLVDWIEKECGLKELAGALYSLIHKQGSLSGFAVMILEFVGFYDSETIREVEQVLKRGAGLSSIEKRKSQVDYLVRKKKYVSALYGYDILLKRWEEQETEGAVLPAVSCLAAILHNKGVAYAGMMQYDMAADFFMLAYEKDKREEYYIDYLAAKRMRLSENEYVAFVAGIPERYQHTLELEKKVERFSEEWEQQPEYLQLYNRREYRTGGNGKKYYEENERLTQLLKDNYRDRCSD